MQIFTSSSLRTRNALPCEITPITTNLSQRICVIPATSRLGHVAEKVSVQASTRYRIPQLERPQWIACMEGGVRVLDGGLERAVLASGDVFVPELDASLVLHAVVGSVVGRAIALKRFVHDTGVTGRGEFLVVEPGEPNWAQHFDTVGLCWAACHHGAFCLQWRDATMPDGLRTILLEAGMTFVPAPGEEYCIDALLPDSSLLCCHRVPVAADARLARIRSGQSNSARRVSHAVA